MASFSQMSRADSFKMEERSHKRAKSCSEVEVGDSVTAKALRIPWVLSRIAKYLPAKDIAIMRSTATAWNAEFAPIMRLKWPMLTFDCDAKILRYLRTMRRSTCIPFGGYRLTTSRVVPSRAICHRFFSPPIGFSVVKLWLETCLWGHRGLRRVLFEWTPNLVELEIFCDGDLAEDEDSDSDEDHDKLQSDNDRQWSSIPNLRKIDLAVPNVVDVTPFQATLDLVTDLVRGAVGLAQFKTKNLRANGLLTASLDAMMAYGVGGCLKELTIGQSKHRELRTLVRLSRRATNPLKLRKLSYYDEERRPDAEFCRSLSELLSLQAGTLEQLRIWTEEHSNPIWLPHASRLHSFKISGEFPATFERQTFALNYPNLKKLILRDCIRSAPTFAHPAITQFKFNLFNANDVVALGLCFPSVVEVDVFMAHSELLLPLWTTWPNLEVLRVENAADEEEDDEPPHKLLDEIITGVPQSEFNTLRQAIENGTGTTVELQKNLAQLKTWPGISDLKELREFQFHTDGYSHSMLRGNDSVSDISDHFGFHMPGSKLRICKVNGHEHI